MTLAVVDFTPNIKRKILRAQEKSHVLNFKEAARIYEEVLKENPDDETKIKIYFQLANINLIQFFDVKKSLYYYELIIKESDNPGQRIMAQERLADIYFSTKKSFNKGLYYYGVLLSIVPKLQNYWFYYYRYSMCLYHIGDYQNALIHFEKIIQSKNESDEFYLPAFFQYGLVLFNLKKWDMAISTWENFIAESNNKSDIIKTKFMVANAYETKEDLKNAYDTYYSILGEYPNTEIIKRRLESIYSRRVARKR